MKALQGEWDDTHKRSALRRQMKVTGHRNAPTRFSAWEQARDTHWVEGKMKPDF